jgi:hypothetical protein
MSTVARQIETREALNERVSREQQLMDHLGIKKSPFLTNFAQGAIKSVAWPR